MDDKDSIKSRWPDSFRRLAQIALLILLGIYISQMSCCIALTAVSYSEPTPVFVSHVVQEMDGLTQLWSRNDVYIFQGDKTLDASMGIGCFIGDLDKALNYDQIYCFEDETGEILWKKEKLASYDLLAASPTGIFVTGHGKTTGVNTLSRYDLQCGNLIWRKQWFESNPIGLRFFDNQIQLSTRKPGHDLWVYDIDGKVVKMLNNTDAFLITSDVTYGYDIGLKAVKTDTNEVLWNRDRGSTKMPIFTQDKILCRSEGNSGMVYSLDRATGELLWQVSDIVYSSSVTHSPAKQIVYTLRNNGDLLAINEDTGEITIAAKFSSPLFLPIIDGAAQAYELAYDQEQHILLVSLGDGHQLFAFREKYSSH